MAATANAKFSQHSRPQQRGELCTTVHSLDAAAHCADEAVELGQHILRALQQNQGALLREGGAEALYCNPPPTDVSFAGQPSHVWCRRVRRVRLRLPQPFRPRLQLGSTPDSQIVGGLSAPRGTYQAIAVWTSLVFGLPQQLAQDFLVLRVLPCTHPGALVDPVLRTTCCIQAF